MSTFEKKSETPMIAADAVSQLITDRRVRLLRGGSQFARPRRLRRRPVVDHLLPRPPLDAA